jgi:hypothetical protein
MGDPWMEKCFHLVSSGLNVEPKVVLKCVITEPHRFNSRVVYLTTLWCYWGHLTSRRRRGREEYLRKILHPVLSAVNNRIYLRFENTKVCLRMLKEGESVGKGVLLGAGTAQCKGLLPRVFACQLSSVFIAVKWMGLKLSHNHIWCVSNRLLTATS